MSVTEFKVSMPMSAPGLKMALCDLPDDLPRSWVLACLTDGGKKFYLAHPGDRLYGTTRSKVVEWFEPVTITRAFDMESGHDVLGQLHSIVNGCDHFIKHNIEGFTIESDHLKLSVDLRKCFGVLPEVRVRTEEGKPAGAYTITDMDAYNKLVLDQNNPDESQVTVIPKKKEM